ERRSRGRARSRPLAGSPRSCGAGDRLRRPPPSDICRSSVGYAVRDSVVEERPEVRMRNRIEILAYVDVDHPIKSLGPEYVLQSAERLVSRAARAPMPSVAIRPPVSGRTRPSSAGFGGLNQG